MSVFRYSKYKIRIDPDSQKTQGLHVGDMMSAGNMPGGNGRSIP